MNTSLKQQKNKAVPSSPGVEIHLVDADGRPQGGVFTRYRFEIEPNLDQLGVDLVVELFDLAGGSSVALLAGGIAPAVAKHLQTVIASVIRSRELVTRAVVEDQIRLFKKGLF